MKQPLLRRSYTTATLSFKGRPCRIAVCGAGPSGFYAASRLLSLPHSENVTVDLFEALPVPFGLSRYGVAPDHPEVKNCEHKFEETASDSRFRFFGNAQLGHVSSSHSVHISLDTLAKHYDSTLLSYGASLDRKLGIQGESTLSNIVSARSFVSWYNSHPLHSQTSRMSPIIDLSESNHATIIGQGNVALDVARILLSPIDVLAQTDISEEALSHLSKSQIKHVDIVGRRGPLQLACTTKEVREMMSLPNVVYRPDTKALPDATRLMSEPGQLEMMSDARMKKRLLQLLHKKSSSSSSSCAHSKSWSFQYFRSPIAFNDNAKTGAVKSIDWQINTLVPSQIRPLGDWKVEPDRSSPVVSNLTDIVFKSVGYRSIGVRGIPFDHDRGVVSNDNGRVIDENGSKIPGLYVSGWLSNGPNGVIATTMYDAYNTADLICHDLASSTSQLKGGGGLVDVGQVTNDWNRLVDWKAWQKIDREEKRRGTLRGKPRSKIDSIEELLQVALN